MLRGVYLKYFFKRFELFGFTIIQVNKYLKYKTKS